MAKQKTRKPRRQITKKEQKRLNNLPGKIAWDAGEEQWKRMKKKLKLSKGIWVAVNGNGEYVTSHSENGTQNIQESTNILIQLGLEEKLRKLGAYNPTSPWFSPFFECVDVPWPPVIKRTAHGTINTNRRIKSGRIALGTGEPNLTTSVVK
jgi:hypothetical protein